MKMILDEKLQVLILLSSLPDNWKTLVVSLSNSAPNGVVTLAIVNNSMLNEELRRKELEITSESSAIVTKNRSKNTYRNSYDDDKRDKSKKKTKSRKGIICYYCKKLGHMKNDCQKLKFKNDDLKRYQSRSRDDNNENEHTVIIASDVEVLITCDEGFVNLIYYDSIWVVDSTVSLHITSRHDLFTSYKEDDYDVVRIGNNEVRKISGIWDVCVKISLGCKFIVKPRILIK
jgi:Zinc knuckle